MPTRMTYKDPITQNKVEVDVYHFYTDFETLDCYVVCWAVKEEYWMTVPLFTLTPQNKKEVLKG